MEHKKQEIINTAIDLYAEKGIKNVTIENLAKELRATKGKIYYYFKHGKNDIVSEILKMYESYISNCIPAQNEWNLEEADAEQMLFKLFFQFPEGDMLRFRKIVYIIMSGMHENEQLKQHAINYFIKGREQHLANCLSALANNGKTIAFDPESAARFFNRYLVVCAILDTTRFPYIDDTEKAEEQQLLTVRDCTNFINLLLGKNLNQ